MPAGTANNFLIKYQNMGDERLEGAPSDLIYQVIEIPHPKFRREGANLHYIQILTLKEVTSNLIRHCWATIRPSLIWMGG